MNEPAIIVIDPEVMLQNTNHFLPPDYTDLAKRLEWEWHIAGMYGRTDVVPEITDPVLNKLINLFSSFSYEMGTRERDKDQDRVTKLDALSHEAARQIEARVLELARGND